MPTDATHPSLDSVDLGTSLLSELLAGDFLVAPDQLDRDDHDFLDNFFTDGSSDDGPAPEFDLDPFGDVDWATLFPDLSSSSPSLSSPSSPLDSNAAYSITSTSNPSTPGASSLPTGPWSLCDHREHAGSYLDTPPPFHLNDAAGFTVRQAVVTQALGASSIDMPKHDVELLQQYQDCENASFPFVAAEAHALKVLVDGHGDGDLENKSALVQRNSKKAQHARRRRQDTTPRFECPRTNCDSGKFFSESAAILARSSHGSSLPLVVFARSHNLKVHIDTVHKGDRPFACEVPDCTMAFGRRHDLYRHHISKHTDEGSPRNKKPKTRK
ncbi:hypothetical protein BN946_scf184999.g28 [Trametes cinnabarina]|uniref:C2H2-type domain-containing protein n=1 Tax=Pycnoporus cinnabarinus TaxID=5643 RepID=A0A060SDD0_PYCCI|nr:hypothetical protein BN946_scf184999.g28 [Trametes cinnabarina]